MSIGARQSTSKWISSARPVKGAVLLLRSGLWPSRILHSLEFFSGFGEAALCGSLKPLPCFGLIALDAHALLVCLSDVVHRWGSRIGNRLDTFVTRKHRTGTSRPIDRLVVVFGHTSAKSVQIGEQPLGSCIPQIRQNSQLPRSPVEL